MASLTTSTSAISVLYILAAINTEDDVEPEGGTAEQVRITVT